MEGDYGEAVGWYRKAAEQGITQAQFNLGVAYTAQNLWDEAETAFRRAVRLRDADFEAWTNLGAVYEALDRAEDALACYRKSLVVEPREQEARHRIAQILMGRGEWRAARGIVEEAVDLWRDLVLEREAHRRGIEGWDEPLYYRRKLTGDTIRKRSDRVFAMLYQRHCGRKPEVEVNVASGVLVVGMPSQTVEEWIEQHRDEVEES